MVLGSLVGWSLWNARYMNPPGPVSTNTAGGAWLERFRRFAISTRLLPGLGYKIRPGPGGTVLEILPGSGGTASPVSLEMYLITRLHNEYITCRTWNGSRNGSNFPVIGSTDVNIAKPHTHRMSVTTEVLDGITVTYTYSDSNNRFANDGTNAE